MPEQKNVWLAIRKTNEDHGAWIKQQKGHSNWSVSKTLQSADEAIEWLLMAPYDPAVIAEIGLPDRYFIALGAHLGDPTSRLWRCGVRQNGDFFTATVTPGFKNPGVDVGSTTAEDSMRLILSMMRDSQFPKPTGLRFDFDRGEQE